MALVVFGCVSRPVSLTPEEEAVRVYQDAPDCKYEDLGMIASTSGSVGWDVEGNAGSVQSARIIAAT